MRACVLFIIDLNRLLMIVGSIFLLLGVVLGPDNIPCHYYGPLARVVHSVRVRRVILCVANHVHSASARSHFSLDFRLCCDISNLSELA